MTDQHYLGVIDRTSGSTAWLRPLASIDDDGLPNEAEELEESFPERGQVPWFHLNFNVAYGSLWVFGVREASSFDPAAGRFDKYTVDGLPERVDRRIVANFADAEEAREVLSVGIEATLDEKDRAFVIVSKDCLVGPLHMERHNGLIRLDPQNRDIPVNGSALSKHQVISVGWQDQRWRLLWPPRANWSPDFQMDWGTDEAVLARGLRRVRDLASKELAADLGLTNNLIATVSARIGSSSLSSIDRYRVHRATTLVKEGGSNRAIAEALVRYALDLPHVQASIDEAKHMAVAQATAELTRRESELLGDLRTERLNLEGDVSRLHVELDDAINRLSASKEEIQGFLSSVEHTVDAGLEQLLERPGEVIGQSLVLMAAAGKLQNRKQPIQRMSTASSNAKGLSLSETAESLASWAMYQGLASADVLAFAASVLGGYPSVVSGEGGAHALDTVRQALFGTFGNSLTLFLNPGYLSPLDVIKVAQIYTEGLPGDDTERAIATFDGIDRCVLESTFLPFLEEGGGAALRARLWPHRSFSVIGTLSNCSMSLPITRRIWDYSDYHVFERPLSITRLSSKAINRPIAGQITRESLAGISSAEPPAGAWQAFTDHLLSFRPSAATIRRADMLEHVLELLGVDGLVRIETVYRASLIRDLADCPDDERRRFFEVLPESTRLKIALNHFEVDTMKKEDRCTIQ